MRLAAGIALVWLIVAPTAVGAIETEYLQGLRNTSYQRVHSEIVGRSYHVYVKLPDGYQSSDADYPTIYLLDGGALFPLLSSYYHYLNFSEEVPDAIVVGISYGSVNFAGGNYRSTDYTAPSEERDYWGGAGDFQAFLRTELLPLMEGRYRADPERRIIFGQSLGGQFVLYTALTQPDLFWGHIASNPALHRNLPFFLEPRWEGKSSGHSRLFVGSGSNDDPMFRGPALDWMRHWAEIDDLPWALNAVTLEGHTHMSTPPASFRQGMAWLFAKP